MIQHTTLTIYEIADAVGCSPRTVTHVHSNMKQYDVGRSIPAIAIKFLATWTAHYTVRT